MTLITGIITGRWRSKDYPGHIVRMYGSGLKEHALLRPHMDTLNFEDIEKRVLGFYSGHDPRNHFGKLATRRYDK